MLYENALTGNGKRKAAKREGRGNDYPVHHQPFVAVVLLRAFAFIDGVYASKEFPEDTLLDMAERIAEISGAVRVARQPR